MRRPLRHRRRATPSYDELLKDPNVDAVHINSPIPDHAPQSIAALKAGKHVACTVPMAHDASTSAGRSSRPSGRRGKVYMMMETVVYSREYLFVKELYDKGELGRIQFLRGSHQQDMDGWPGYWPGLPPMHYATHCVSPCLAILGKHAEHVVCHGSGRIREELIPKYGSPFAIETATFKIKGLATSCAEVTRSLFDTARQYRESFDAYGSRRSRFEWQQVEDEEPVIHTKSTPSSRCRSRRSPSGSRCPTTPTSCPEPIRSSRSRRRSRTPSTCRSSRAAATAASHPHLVHNFLLACLGEQPALPDADDVGQLDDGRHLRPPVGDEGRREGRDPDVLSEARGSRQHRRRSALRDELQSPVELKRPALGVGLRRLRPTTIARTASG